MVATSGRYAYYWNAFLLSLDDCKVEAALLRSLHFYIHYIFKKGSIDRLGAWEGGGQVRKYSALSWSNFHTERCSQRNIQTHKSLVQFLVCFECLSFRLSLSLNAWMVIRWDIWNYKYLCFLLMNGWMTIRWYTYLLNCHLAINTQTQTETESEAYIMHNIFHFYTVFVKNLAK